MRIAKDFQLFTDRFLLRIPGSSDIPHIFEAAQIPGFADGMKWDPPTCMSELELVLRGNIEAWEAGTAYNFTIAHHFTDEFVGRIVIRQKTEEIFGVGFWTHPKHQSQGIMNEVLETIIRFGFETLSATRIEADHALWNKASEKVLQSNGFKFVRYIENGFQKQGCWIAVNLLAIDRVDWINAKSTD